MVDPGCPFAGCQEHQTLESLSAHIDVCEYRPAECICGFKGPLYLVHTHKRSCKKIRCPVRRILEQRFGIDIPISRCSHGPAERCSLETFIKAVRDSDPERIADITAELEYARANVVV